MAMATTCCLSNFNPPPSPPPPPPPQNSRSLSPTSTNNQSVPWKSKGNEGWWQKRCVLGVAGVAMGLQMVGESGGIEMGNSNNVNFVDSRKWSEERMCPQWRLNSLETVVPENLPRPAARRRWDPAALPHTHTAPPLRTTHTTSRSTRCFSM